ncbi:hypothetical protein C8J56DRAFT_1048855 [Mycena floridula]|nr:hypothetical protein C8J56DRAFT_1048855 [Mycena floridula]
MEYEFAGTNYIPYEKVDYNPNVLSCLAKANFTNTAALQRIELFQLREMGLKAGNVAALQDAVEEWAEKYT